MVKREAEMVEESSARDEALMPLSWDEALNLGVDSADEIGLGMGHQWRIKGSG